jgi:hypothetical protein
MLSREIRSDRESVRCQESYSDQERACKYMKGVFTGIRKAKSEEQTL